MKFLILVISLLMFAQLFGQQQFVTEQDLADRATLIENNQEYITLEKTWDSEGKLFPAVVIDNSNNSVTQYNFILFKDLNPNWSEDVRQRFLGACPFISQLIFNGQQINVEFQTGVTEEQKLNFFKMIGYNGYQIL